MSLRNKAVSWDWHDISNLSPTTQTYNLTEQQAVALSLVCRQMAWSTRWDNAPDNDTLQSFADETLYNLLNPSDCAPNTPDTETCTDYANYHKIVSYAPQNPFTQPQYKPDGYYAPPFRLWGDFSPNWLPTFAQNWIDNITSWATGYLPTDVIVAIDAIPLLANLWDLYTNWFPRIRVDFSGVGTIELHLLNMPLGGICAITLNRTFLISDLFLDLVDDTVEVIDLNRDILSFPAETSPDVIHEITITQEGNHYVECVFLPVVDDAFIPIRFGGGFRKAVLCGLSETTMASNLIRLNPNNAREVQESTDGGQTWTTQFTINDGVSPIISVNSNSPTDYTLRVQGAGFDYTTPNLKGADGQAGQDAPIPQFTMPALSDGSGYRLAVDNDGDGLYTPLADILHGQAGLSPDLNNINIIQDYDNQEVKFDFDNDGNVEFGHTVFLRPPIQKIALNYDSALGAIQLVNNGTGGGTFASEPLPIQHSLSFDSNTNYLRLLDGNNSELSFADLTTLEDTDPHSISFDSVTNELTLRDSQNNIVSVVDLNALDNDAPLQPVYTEFIYDPVPDPASVGYLSLIEGSWDGSQIVAETASNHIFFALGFILPTGYKLQEIEFQLTVTHPNTLTSWDYYLYPQLGIGGNIKNASFTNEGTQTLAITNFNQSYQQYTVLFRAFNQDADMMLNAINFKCNFTG